MYLQLASARLALVAGLAGALLSCGRHNNIPRTRPNEPLAPRDVATSAGASLLLPPMDGSLAAYLSFSVEHSPRVRAAFERWRAAEYGTRQSGRLPEPTIAFGYFARSVETRVGPQRYNVGITQSIPWLRKLSESKAASKEEANALALRTDAEVLALRRDIANFYWTLWQIGEEERLLRDHDVVLESLSSAVRGRLLTGASTLADVSQVDLTIARHHDHRDAHSEARARVSAKLVAALGASDGPSDLEANDEPPKGVPTQPEADLLTQAVRHPMIGQYRHLAESKRHRAEAAAAERYPRFQLGANLIGVGEIEMPGVVDNGKDAVLVTAGISLPLWLDSYAAAESSARATSSAHAAMEADGRRQAEGAVRSALATLRDSQRRLNLYEYTLIPQAQTTFQAVTGGYQVKTSTVAAVLLAQKDLIELQLEHARTRAEHARTLAVLEYLVASPLQLGRVR